MTVDDENSIYVGGLSYSSTEDSLRRAFDPFGAIVAVKIVNDRSTRGKCYGFVTFRNPRSVIDAITEMDGKKIDGRVVRVNEVTSRGGRLNFGQENFRRNNDRGGDWDRGRDRERDYDRDRDSFSGRYSDRSRERELSWGHDEKRERGYEHGRDRDQARNVFFDGDQSRDGDMTDNERKQGRISDWNWERDHNLGGDHDGEIDGANGDGKIVNKDAEQYSRKQNGSMNNDRSREFSSDSSDSYSDEVKGKLETTIQRRDELKKEISQMEEKLEHKQLLVSDLQKKVKKLEDALISTKKISLQRKVILTKLCKVFLQVKDQNEKLKCSEQELQSLIDSAMMEIDVGDDLGGKDGILANGNA